MLCALVSDAFSAALTASLDRDSIVLGEQVTLTLKIEDGQPQEPISLPRVDGVQVIQDSMGQNSSVVVNNGVRSTVLTYSVALDPTRAGEFVIPPLRAKVNGQILQTQPIKLKVAATDSSAPPPDFADKMAFLWIVPPKTNLFINEPFVVDFRLYFRSDVHRYTPLDLMPDGDGLAFGKFVEGGHYQRRVGNATFTVVPLSIAITPARTGTVSINPINATTVVNSPDAMDGFFGPRMTPQQVTLTSDKIDLQVAPLPNENVPPNFNGAVGNYTMTVTAGPTNIVAGDPVTLHIQISGQGALDSLVLPNQTGWDNFKVYPPTSKVNPSDQLGIEGTKTFEEIVTPQSSDIKALPPVSFSFFDPEHKRYRTLTHPPMALLVRAANPGVMPAIANAARSGQENSPGAPDILPIKQHVGAVAQIRPPLVQQPFFLTLQGVPALALISSIIWRKRKESLANNPRLRRQRQVEQLVHDGQIDLQNRASENNSDEFFATLFRLLQERLGERLDLPASAITEAVIEERLRPRGVPESTLVSLHEIFQACNLARYAPVRSSEELADLIPKAESVLNELRDLNL